MSVEASVREEQPDVELSISTQFAERCATGELVAQTLVEGDESASAVYRRRAAE